MRNPISWASAVVLGLGMALAVTGARADEEKVALDKVPRAVVDAVKAKFPGATIKQADKEVEDGKTTYELGITHNGHSIDVSAKPDGTIVSVETEIKAADLPAAVSKAVKDKYPRGEIKKAEKVEEDGKTTYEVIVEKAPGKRMELVLDRSGKILEEEEAGKD
ncbi:MAG: PepSY-like domain-containing protein [Planctomycetia bacterium]|nr:PepSY-like domain-containing protein [Planctomycetia bacterium]